jgi:hypothetical protein
MAEERNKGSTDEGRRDFLRKSAYAAYATPVIMAMLVEKASAGKSWNHGGTRGCIPKKSRAHSKGPGNNQPSGPGSGTPRRSRAVRRFSGSND